MLSKKKKRYTISREIGRAQRDAYVVQAGGVGAICRGEHVLQQCPIVCGIGILRGVLSTGVANTKMT